MSAPFASLSIPNLRRLLDDDDQCNRIIRYSDKFQRLTRATGNILVSNRRLAKGSLLHRPAFRDTKLLLAMKYKQLDKLLGKIRDKQSYLDERYWSLLRMAQLSLMEYIASAEQESELLFQGFLAGEIPVADFLEGFQRLRKLHHVRLVLVNKIQDMNVAAWTPGGPAEDPLGDVEWFCPSSPAAPLGSTHCGLFCSMPPVFVLPAIGRSLVPLPAVHPLSGALRGGYAPPPLQQVVSYCVHDHQHHQQHHHQQHQHQQCPLGPRQGRKPACFQKPQIKPGRRGPGPD